MDTILLCLYRLRTQAYSHRSKTGRSWMLLEELRRASDPYPDTEDDRRAYEFCVFSKLRNRLRAGDVWVDRSGQYQDFETYLIPKPMCEMLKAEGPLPVQIETEVQRYLESRRSALTQELATVATLAERGELPDVDLTEGDLKITPLRAVTPPEAESLRDAAYDLLPCIKNHEDTYAAALSRLINSNPLKQMK